MPRTIDLIRTSSVSAETMRAAAHGALPISAAETIEVLVFLTSNSVFGKQAAMTLAGWDATACMQVAGDPATPKEVLDYFLTPENRRPDLLSLLIENPSIDESQLLSMTQEHLRTIVSAMLASPRVQRSPNLINALISNPALTPEDLDRLREALRATENTDEGGTTYYYEKGELEQYMLEHAEEIAAEQNKPFELVRDPASEAESIEEELSLVATGDKADAVERLSVFKRISRMSVSERVQLAIKGTREERFILIRDGSKVVSKGVLESPRITDQEVEGFAAMKNVQEAVLRGIAGKRKFIKNYAVIKNLANNPRCPLDVQLGLVKHLLVNDLRTLSANKDVGDTIRKLALKMYKDKTERKRS